MTSSPHLSHVRFVSNPEIKNLCSELKSLIETNSDIFASRSFAEELQGQGFLFNKLSATVFDRVFSIPNTHKYIYSNADRYSQETLIRLTDSHRAPLEKMHFLIEQLGLAIFESSHTPGYTLTSKFGFETRERIPVHTHKNHSEFDDGNELNLSVALRLSKKDPNSSAKMLFFPYKKEQEKDRTHDHLLETTNFLEFSIENDVSIFLFDSKRLPHTVRFSDDLVLWAVFNGVKPKSDYQLNTVNTVATFE